MNLYLCTNYTIMERYPADIPAIALRSCADDIISAVQAGHISLDMQLRAYDLLDYILGESHIGFPAEATAYFSSSYDQHGDSFDKLYDEAALKAEMATRLEPLKTKMNEARFAAASAASLHEFAKEVFEIWQTSGIFARRRALKELRERAGFRLEGHRIGNYVAKTFDLMNEAQARFAAAQQLVFASDVTYKIQPGIHARIAEILSSD